jgi:phage terminase large subunit-like protein
MGLRGPGAKPVKRTKALENNVFSKKPKWQVRGLSRAERVIRFCESLVITSGSDAGKPLRLRLWQRDIISSIYSVDASGSRAVRTAVVSMGRKNGKSALAAALALVHLVGPESVQRGQIVSAASDRAQAALIYKELQAFALASEEIAERLVFRDFNKTVEDTITGSTFSALSSDARKAHGLSPVVAICDEVAQWHGRELLDALRTGQGAHAEPLLLAISTRSPDPDNPLEELLRYGEAGDDATFKAFVWSAPLDSDPWSPETWALANPGLGDFRSLKDVEIQAKQAQKIPSLESSFRAYILNEPVAADDRFIGPVEWDACAGTAEARGPVYAGLDLSSGANDLTAFSLYWPETGRLDTWGFIPKEVLETKSHEDRADYRLWANQSHVVAMPGRAIDRAWLGAWIAERTAGLDLQGIASDRWGLADLEASWCREGIELVIEPHGTGYRDMSPALRAFEIEVVEARLRHSANPLLRWAISNTVIDSDPAGNRKPAKNRAIGRIDPAVSAILAVSLASRAPVAAQFDFTGLVL